MNSAQPFDTVTHWSRVCQRLLALGSTLTEAQGRIVVAATPDWTVKDVFAHQAGVASDILENNLEGVTTDPWTEIQVENRRSDDLTQVTQEWATTQPQVAGLLQPISETVDPRLALDAFIHECDLHAVLDIPPHADDPIADFGAGLARRGWEANQRKAGMASVRVEVDNYELLRAATGRRSLAQVLAWNWQDPEPDDPEFRSKIKDLLEQLVIFKTPEQDVVG